MEVRVLGPLEVVDGTRPVALPRGRGRALLALLALRAGETVVAERLIHELWGPVPPRTATKGLHNLVADLRRRLAPAGPRDAASSVLATSGSGYVLDLDPDRVDAHHFRRLLDDAVDRPAAERAAGLRAALALWRGPALADLAYEPFAQAEIVLLEELRLTAIEERVEADLALGRHAALVGELEGLVSGHPFRERLRGQLMLALYRGGRQADALEVHRTGRQLLVDELGVEPGPDLAGLGQAILRHDPALTAPAASGSPATATPRREVEPWLAAERRTVTVACVDLADSETGNGDADPELVGLLHTRIAAVAAAAIERHGGTVQGPIGGILVALFGLPEAHEDDALRAVRAAVELRDVVAAIDPEPGIGVTMVARVGVSTGEIVVADATAGLAGASGDVVRFAGRLQQAAADGDVLVGEATRQLVGDAVRVESVAALVLDRRGRPATVWRVAGLAVPSQRARGTDVARTLVGRRGELTRLHAALQSVRRNGRAVRFTVVGEPGLGKSRLADAFVEAIAGEVRVLSCRCPAYGQGITFWPLRELVEQATGGHQRADIAALLAGQDDADAVAAPLAAAVGTSDEPDAGRDLFPAARRLFDVLSKRGPVAVVVDDAHWGQPTFLDLLDHLTDALRAPLLVLCLARPELFDARPDWAASPHGPDLLVLGPLSPQDSERLAADRLAGRLVPDEVVSEVVELAQGNPLFIEQLVASLRDEGKLRFPPSVHALLSARLDRLGPAERDVLRCASVIGTTFWLDTLAALVPAPLRTVLERHLDTLRRKELIDPAPRTLLGRPGFTFRHALVQQAAYRTTTRQARAELHERLADWLDRQDAPDLDEVVAHHLEQAHAQRHRLGLADEATRALARRAGERLARCGLRAYRRFDMTAAEHLLSRARALLPADHPDRHEVLRRLAEAYPTLGRLADAEAVLTEMLEQPPSPRDEQRLRLEQLRVRLIAGPDPVRFDAVRAEVDRAIELLEPAGDDVGMSQACYLLATMHLRAGRIRDLDEVVHRGLEHARRSGDLRELLGAMWFPAWALVVGPTPVPEAIRGCEELLRDGPGEHVGVVTDLARLHAMRGAFDTARELITRGRRQVVEHVRVRRALTVVAQRSAEVEALAGHLAAAEAVLRSGVEVALDVGERDQTAQVAAALALVLCARGSSEEAATFAALAQREAPAESVVAQALWRAATGRVLAAGKDDASAQRLVREAIALVPDDLLNLQADLQLDLAVTLDLGGRHDAAAAARRKAADRYRRKGNVAGVRRASGSGTSGSST